MPHGEASGGRGGRGDERAREAGEAGETGEAGEAGEARDTSRCKGLSKYSYAITSLVPNSTFMTHASFSW